METIAEKERGFSSARINNTTAVLGVWCEGKRRSGEVFNPMMISYFEDNLIYYLRNSSQLPTTFENGSSGSNLQKITPFLKLFFAIIIHFRQT